LFGDDVAVTDRFRVHNPLERTEYDHGSGPKRAGYVRGIARRNPLRSTCRSIQRSLRDIDEAF